MTVAAERKEEGGFGLSWIKVETLILFFSAATLCCSLMCSVLLTEHLEQADCLQILSSEPI